MISTEIRNTDDLIDSRDVVERIEELRELRDDDPEELSEDERAELDALENWPANASSMLQIGITVKP